MTRLAVILFLFLSAELSGQEVHKVDFSTDNCRSYIDINGQTNLNNFHLSQIIDHRFYLSIEDTHWRSATDTSSMTEIHVPVKQFSTTNPLLYRDFLELLNARKHPEIIIRIPNVQLEHILHGSDTIKPLISITLAGSTHDYRITCTIETCSTKGFFLRGEKQIKLTDFNITPPVKSLGLIRVKNEVIINFGFNMELMNETTSIIK